MTSLGQRFRVLERDGFVCRYCGRKAPAVPLEVDHILPRSRGGRSTNANLITACFDCNRGKRDRVLPDELAFAIAPHDVIAPIRVMRRPETRVRREPPFDFKHCPDCGLPTVHPYEGWGDMCSGHNRRYELDECDCCADLRGNT